VVLIDSNPALGGWDTSSACAEHAQYWLTSDPLSFRYLTFRPVDRVHPWVPDLFDAALLYVAGEQGPGSASSPRTPRATPPRTTIARVSPSPAGPSHSPTEDRGGSHGSWSPSLSSSPSGGTGGGSHD